MIGELNFVNARKMQMHGFCKTQFFSLPRGRFETPPHTGKLKTGKTGNLGKLANWILQLHEKCKSPGSRMVTEFAEFARYFSLPVISVFSLPEGGGVSFDAPGENLTLPRCIFRAFANLETLIHAH